MPICVAYFSESRLVRWYCAVFDQNNNESNFVQIATHLKTLTAFAAAVMYNCQIATNLNLNLILNVEYAIAFEQFIKCAHKSTWLSMHIHTYMYVH